MSDIESDIASTGSKNCPNNCSAHGICDYDTGKCICDIDYGGDDCSTLLACPGNCNQRGKCDVDKKECICSKPYTGPMCNVVDRGGNVDYIHIFLYILSGIFGLISIACLVILYRKYYRK